MRVLGLLLERGVGLIERAVGGRASAARGSPTALGAKPRRWDRASRWPVIRGIRPLHPSLAAWVQAGEAGGNLPGLLDAAQRFQQGWDRLATRMMRWKSASLAVGLFVTLVALAVLLPVLQMNKAVMP